MAFKDFVRRCITRLGQLTGIPDLVRSSSESVNAQLTETIDQCSNDQRKENEAFFYQNKNAIQACGNYTDKGTQILLGIKYRELMERGIQMDFADVEFSNHSQTGEDGILWYIFSIIGTTNQVSVEMCAGVGSECNSANLILNHGWNGVLFDGDEENIAVGRRYFSEHPSIRLPPKMRTAWITAENINTLLSDAGTFGEIDLFSLDVDGVDYWLWNALEIVSPRVILLEVQPAWTDEVAVTVPYSPDFVATWVRVGDPENDAYAQYGGASLPAFVKLAKTKGYRLIGANSMGYNAFFLRNDVAQEIFPEVNAGSCFTHPVGKYANHFGKEALAGMEWQKV